MPTKPGPVLPVHHSVRVTSSSVVDILDAHYGPDVNQAVTAWYRVGLLPGVKSGTGRSRDPLRGRRHLRRRRSGTSPRPRRSRRKPRQRAEPATAGQTGTRAKPGRSSPG